MSASTSFPLTIPVPIAQGGTNAITAAAARTSLGTAASGANTDITSLAGVVANAFNGHNTTGFRFKDASNALSGGMVEITDFGGLIIFYTSTQDGAFSWRNTGGSVLANLSGSGSLTLTGDTLNQAAQKTPASASAAGVAGDICHDASFIYVCTATNTWKRAAISTW